MAKENDKLKGKKVKWATYTISMWLSWAVLGYVNYFSTDHLHLNVGVVGTIFWLPKSLMQFQTSLLQQLWTIISLKKEREDHGTFVLSHIGSV